MLIVKTPTKHSANSLNKWSCFLGVFSFSVLVYGAKSPSYFPLRTGEIAFYKTPRSPFPSGQARLEKLTQGLQAETISAPGEVKYYHNSKFFTPQELSPTTALSLAGPGHEKDEFRDLGKFFVIVDTHLFAKPSTDSAKITKIFAGNVLPLSSDLRGRFTKGFIKVRYHGAEGYVNISHTISKFDFAVWIYPKQHLENTNKTSINNGWVQVKNRLFDEIETINGDFIHLEDIEGIWTDPSKALISSSKDPFPLWTQLRIIRSPRVLWKSSRLPGHQIVWWRETDTQTLTQLDPDQITIDELLRKEIFSVSFHPKNPRKALVSANGVYQTSDGQTWKKLKQFDHFSGPVHYFNDLLLFVGPYRSTDGGKNFENFIRIDELSKTIFESLGYAPHRLELRSIKTTSSLKIIIDVDIGSKKIKVQSPIYAQNWSVLKAKN